MPTMLLMVHLPGMQGGIYAQRYHTMERGTPLCAETINPPWEAYLYAQRLLTHHGRRDTLCAEATTHHGRRDTLCAEASTHHGKKDTLCAEASTHHGRMGHTLRRGLYPPWERYTMRRGLYPTMVRGTLCAEASTHHGRTVVYMRRGLYPPWENREHYAPHCPSP